MKFKNYINEKRYYGNQAVGVIIKSLNTGRILVVKRAFSIWEGGSYSITISGKIDTGETAKEAAYREIEEELKYKGDLNLNLLDVFKDSNNNPHFQNNFTFFTYTGVVKEEFKPKLNWETINYFWWNGKDKINGKLHTGTLRLLKKYKKRLFK